MTIQEKIGKGKKLTSQEIAKRARLALRTSAVNVGLTATAPIIVGKIVDDLIPKAILDTGEMTVRFDTSTVDVPHDADEWELYQHKGTSGVDTLIASDKFGPVAGRPQLLDIPVDTTTLDDDDLTKSSTTYQVRFIFFKGNDGNPDRLPWVTAEIDRTAPEQDKLSGIKFKPERVVFQNLPLPATIDDDWLSNNTELSLTINTAYDFYRSDDVIDVYIGTNYGVGTPVYTQALTSSTVSIPRDDLPPLDSLYYIWYILRDVVGNESSPSLSGSFTVRRRPPPVLIPCEIPKGILPDVIDLEDLETPVYVNVRYTTNGQANDQIVPTVTNGTLPISLASQSLGTDTARTLQFPISTSRLLALWGNATAEVSIVASYQFARGLEQLRPSVDTRSALDFTYRGPVNPVFPERENPDMARVTVLGASNTPNHIIADDRGQDADISTPMIIAPNPWLPVGDETARLWFDGKEVDAQLLSAGSVTDLTFTMDKSIIDAAGPGKKIAYWTIEETGGRNVIKSPDTEVTIDNVRVSLPAPTVRLFNGFVSCRHLTLDFQLPVTVTIDQTYMPTNTEVTVKSVGTEDAQGLKEIEETRFETKYRIDGSETGGVFTVNIQPYVDKLKPIQPPRSSGLPNGYIKIWYEVTIFGVPTPSTDFFNQVSLLNDSGNYCEGTPTSEV